MYIQLCWSHLTLKISFMLIKSTRSLDTWKHTWVTSDITFVLNIVPNIVDFIWEISGQTWFDQSGKASQ